MLFINLRITVQNILTQNEKKGRLHSVTNSIRISKLSLFFPSLKTQFHIQVQITSSNIHCANFRVIGILIKKVAII